MWLFQDFSNLVNLKRINQSLFYLIQKKKKLFNEGIYCKYMYAIIKQINIDNSHIPKVKKKYTLIIYF